MADYETLLDAQVLAFVRESQSFFPDGSAELPIEAQRDLYAEMVAAFRTPRPAIVEVSERSAGHVPLRIYTAGDPSRSVLYCHGGGFVMGDLNSHDDVCAELCAQTGYRVVSVDYRLAPEARHPAQFDDVWTALVWVIESFEGGVVLAGDSAGALLCAAVAQAARGRTEQAQILGQVLIYPALGGDPARLPSYVEHAQAPMLSAADMAYYTSVRCDPQSAPPQGDATFAPLADSDFSGIVPTVLFSADCDPLRDECRAYRDALRDAGAEAHWLNEEGLVHGYLRARHRSDLAGASFERISLAIEALGQEIWSFSDEEPEQGDDQP